MSIDSQLHAPHDEQEFVELSLQEVFDIERDAADEECVSQTLICIDATNELFD